MHSVVLEADDMTIEEAINYITYHGFISDDVKDMAIAALEKQIPKKPYDVNEKENDDFYYLGFMCPSCNEAVIGQPYRPNCCKHCGQALNWSEVEE